MTGPAPTEDPRPRDVALEQALPEQVEQLEEQDRLEEQEQVPDPESWEAPDAG